MLKVTYYNTKTGETVEDIYTDEEVLALNTELELADYKNPITGKVLTGIIGWHANSLHNKARQKVDEIVEKSGRGSRYTDLSKKFQIIRELAKERHELLKGAKQRQVEIEAKIRGE